MTHPVTHPAARWLPILGWIALAILVLPAQGWDDPAVPAPEEPKPAAAPVEGEAPKPAVPAAPKPPEFSWDLSPYDIRIWLHADRSASLPEAVSPAWQSQLAEKVQAALGPGCGVRVAAMPDAARREFRGSLSSLTAAALAPSVAKPPPDKIFLIGCFAGGNAPSLEIRELDLRTWNLSANVRIDLPHRSLLAEEIARGVSEVFRPLARVERAEGNSASILPRAGGLLIEARSRGELRPGDILRVYMRRADRFGEAKPQDVGPINWTYLMAGEASGRFLQSQVVSALRQPLSGKVSSRVEKLALLVRPQGGETILFLKSRQAPHPPLAGYEIFDLQPDEQPRPLGITDGEGRLTIPSRAAGIYRLHVRHGREVLARLPLVPGSEREAIAYLADDGPRLDAEGFLSGVQENLIDTVARRQVAAARIERLIGRSDFAGAAREMELVRLLPTRAQLAAQLSNQQAKYTSGDKSVQGKIDKLFTDTRQLLEKYLDPQEIEAMSAKVDRAKRGETAPPPMPAPAPMPEPAPAPIPAPLPPMNGAPSMPIPVGPRM